MGTTSQSCWRHPGLRHGRPLLLSALVILSLGAPAWAQYNTGQISGVVKDPQGGVLPGAAVVARQVASGLEVARVSDVAGRFFLPSLPAGEYSVSVELHGF